MQSVVVHVKKAGDVLPVAVTSQREVDALVLTHSAANVLVTEEAQAALDANANEDPQTAAPAAEPSGSRMPTPSELRARKD